MKALSMKQPVPELIFQGKKTIETRTWNTQMRGTFLIHASMGFIDRLIEKFSFKKEELKSGFVLGKADLVEVRPYLSLEAFNKDYEKHLVTKPVKLPTYGYILKNVERFEKPLKVKGQLNFFEVDIEKKQQTNLKEFF